MAQYVRKMDTDMSIDYALGRIFYLHWVEGWMLAIEIQRDIVFGELSIG